MTPPDARVGLEADVALAGRSGAPPDRDPVRPGSVAAVRKYTKIFRVSLVERMAYRGDFLIGTLLRFLPLVTTILLWQAIYKGSGQSSLSGSQGGIAFRYREMIAYLLLTHISRMFSSMPGLAGGIARDIRDGTLKRYLIQPVNMIGYLLSYRVAHKVAYIVTSALPYAILFLVCRSFFDGFPDATTMAAYVVSLVLSFCVGFFFEASVGMVGFWFLEVTSLLDLLPEPWVTILKGLPFQYMAYFPAVVFLGKVRGADLVRNLVAEALWAVVFMLLARASYRLGLKRYSAFGG
jgi:ABC-2 type transport system permease protein